jgi:hypothetical protein
MPPMVASAHKFIDRVLVDAERDVQQLIAEAAIGADYVGVRNAQIVAEALRRLKDAQTPGDVAVDSSAPEASPTNRYIVAALRDAEEGLKSLLTEAAAAGDYESVDQIGAVAGVVHEMGGQFAEEPPSKVEPVKSSDKPKSKPKSKSKPKASTQTPSPSKRPAVVVTEAGQSHDAYPKFKTSKKHIERVGWSKTENCEYIHRVSRSSYQHTVKALEQLVAEGIGAVGVSSIQEQVQRTCTEGVRSHEVYTVLGMLVEQGVIESAGADRYLVPTNVWAVATNSLND